MNPMWLFDRISLGLLGLVLAVPEIAACSEHDSLNTNSTRSPQGAAGTFGVAAASGATGISSASSVGSAGAPSVAGAFAAGGFASSAGAGGTNIGGDPGTGLGGTAGTAISGSAGGTASNAGSGSAGSGSAGWGNSAGAAEASAAFARVSAILGKNCGISGCHADKQSPHFVPGPMLYATLTGPGTVLAECDYTRMVEAGDPSKSALVRLMNKKCGSFIMPPSCNKSTCLPEADLKALSDWIQAGASP